MLKELVACSLSCLMGPDDVAGIREMVASRFPAIEVGVGPEASGEVPVTFDIPKGIPMCGFFTAFSKILNQGATPRERGVGG